MLNVVEKKPARVTVIDETTYNDLVAITKKINPNESFKVQEGKSRWKHYLVYQDKNDRLFVLGTKHAEPLEIDLSETDFSRKLVIPNEDPNELAALVYQNDKERDLLYQTLSAGTVGFFAGGVSAAVTLLACQLNMIPLVLPTVSQSFVTGISCVPALVTAIGLGLVITALPGLWQKDGQHLSSAVMLAVGAALTGIGLSTTIHLATLTTLTVAVIKNALLYSALSGTCYGLIGGLGLMLLLAVARDIFDVTWEKPEVEVPVESNEIQVYSKHADGSPRWGAFFNAAKTVLQGEKKVTESDDENSSSVNTDHSI